MLGLALVGQSDGHAQDTARAAGLPSHIFVGSDAENYLRYLQTLGIVEAQPWSIRGFSPEQLRRLAPNTNEHPWALHPILREASYRQLGVRFELAPFTTRTWYNTAFPFGGNDGAVWVARGLTSSLEAGASAAWGPLTAVLAPTWFWAQNQRFTMMPNGQTGLLEYADPMNPFDVDRPQRFGPSAYSRLDWGQSAVRFDALGASIALTNANEWWGPMDEFPYILSNNAPGFPHISIGSSQPIDLLVGQVHGRLIYARLEQSNFSSVSISSGRRFASGAIALFTPRGVPGLEVGAIRFFHVPWPDSGVTREYYTHIFENLLKGNVGKVFAPVAGDPTNQSYDNQLASLFLRWTASGSGFEAYAEYGREDHSWHGRDLKVEPDHSAVYGVGLRKAWRGSHERITTLRTEIINFQPSSLERHREQGGTYASGFTRQGHTQRGQSLGTGFAIRSGAAATMEVGRFSPRGASSVSLSRMLVLEPGFNHPGDVQYVLRLDRSARFRENTIVRAGVAIVDEFARYLKDDAMNWQLRLSVEWLPKVGSR